MRASAEPRYRIPDICVKALPHKVTPILERPDLVIEVLSPDDRLSDTLQRISDYREAGIPHIWLADPYERAVFMADDGGLRRVVDGVLANYLVGTIDFRSLFAELDEPAE